MSSDEFKFIKSAFAVFSLYCVLGFVFCCNVFVFLKAMSMFVYLNKVVIFLICGLQQLNVFHGFSFSSLFFRLNMNGFVLYLCV